MTLSHNINTSSNRMLLFTLHLLAIPSLTSSFVSFQPSTSSLISPLRTNRFDPRHGSTSEQHIDISLPDDWFSSSQSSIVGSFKTSAFDFNVERISREAIDGVIGLGVLEKRMKETDGMASERLSNKTLFAPGNNDDDDIPELTFDDETFSKTTTPRAVVSPTPSRPNPSSSTPCRTCRVVASGDNHLPTSFTSPLHSPLAALFHAISQNHSPPLSSATIDDAAAADDARLISTLRDSLETAGFARIGKRDWDLCEALNAGYLLRLSIVPDTRSLDPHLGREFVPDDSDLLFDGRILVFRRGYGTEVSRGRMLLPKLDYLQASVVQTAASRCSRYVGRIERKVTAGVGRLGRRATYAATRGVLKGIESLPGGRDGFWRRRLRRAFVEVGRASSVEVEDDEEMAREAKKTTFFKLNRYGGSKIRFVGTPDLNNALDPFLLCFEETKKRAAAAASNGTDVSSSSSCPPSPASIHDIERRVRNSLDAGEFLCGYDEKNSRRRPDSFRLLERVSLSNIVDLVSSGGRRKLIKAFLSKSELKEPTYEEVVVIWRPLPPPPPPPSPLTTLRSKIIPYIYPIAEHFSIDDRLPPPPSPPPPPPPPPLQIRIFSNVPMANLPAVFPRTRLVFRPADAFVFDSISLFSLVAVLASQRYDNPKLDLIALISFGFWLLRTVLRYSNKLARYDLLVKNFLTGKISQRGVGAVRYVVGEGGRQRAVRVGIVYDWLVRRWKRRMGGGTESVELERDVVVREGSEEGMFLNIEGGMKDGQTQQKQRLSVDMDAALKDLDYLNMIQMSKDGAVIESVEDGPGAMNALRRKWITLFDELGNDDAVDNKRNKEQSDEVGDDEERQDDDKTFQQRKKQQQPDQLTNLK